MKWVETPKMKCECIKTSGYEEVCEMHLRAGYGKFYKANKNVALGKREVAYTMRKEVKNEQDSN